MAIPGSYWLLMQFIAFSMHQEHNHRQAKVWKFRFLILHFLSLTFVSSTVFKDHQKMSHLNFRGKKCSKFENVNLFTKRGEFW